MQGQFIGLTSEPSLQSPPHFLKRDVKLLYAVPKSYIGNQVIFRKRNKPGHRDGAHFE